jgi:hypothetical protein
MPSIIKKTGLNLGVQVIDIFDALGGSELKHKNYFCDSVHPND